MVFPSSISNRLKTQHIWEEVDYAEKISALPSETDRLIDDEKSEWGLWEAGIGGIPLSCFLIIVRVKHQKLSKFYIEFTEKPSGSDETLSCWLLWRKRRESILKEVRAPIFSFNLFEVQHEVRYICSWVELFYNYCEWWSELFAFERAGLTRSGTL